MSRIAKTDRDRTNLRDDARAKIFVLLCRVAIDPDVLMTGFGNARDLSGRGQSKFVSGRNIMTIKIAKRVTLNVIGRASARCATTCAVVNG